MKKEKLAYTYKESPIKRNKIKKIHDLHNYYNKSQKRVYKANLAYEEFKK